MPQLAGRGMELRESPVACEARKFDLPILRRRRYERWRS
jgi:hypothetical protein